MRPFAILLLALRPLAAQSLADSVHLDAFRKAFDAPQPAAALDCRITPIRPALNFSFRFESGYVMHVPFSQFRGKGHRWAVLLQVKPESGDPTYLIQSFDLPDVPDTHLLGRNGGWFLVGEGKYRVQALVQDDLYRECRAQWDIEAKLDSSQRKLQPAMPPDSVAEIASPLSGPLSGPSTAPPKIGRLTILLHAAPLSPRLSKLQDSDVFTLTGSLSSLLNQLPARSVRLVAFNLEQQKVLLRRDSFTVADIGDVTKAIGEIELGKVDYKTLQNVNGPIAVLTDLIRAELQASEPPDEVVFLGPQARQHKPVPKDAFEAAHAGAPRFYYVQYRRLPRIVLNEPETKNGRPAGGGRRGQPFGGPPLADLAVTDSIADAVGQLNLETAVRQKAG